MSSLVSSRIAALRQKLREFEHSGHFVSSEDMTAMVRELAGIANAARAQEDEIAQLRRQKSGRAIGVPIAVPGPVPLGRLYFQPEPPALGGQA